jgi:hypothetical protein
MYVPGNMFSSSRWLCTYGPPESNGNKPNYPNNYNNVARLPTLKYLAARALGRGFIGNGGEGLKNGDLPRKEKEAARTSLHPRQPPHCPRPCAPWSSHCLHFFFDDLFLLALLGWIWRA